MTCFILFTGCSRHFWLLNNQNISFHYTEYFLTLWYKRNFHHAGCMSVTLIAQSPQRLVKINISRWFGKSSSVWPVEQLFLLQSVKLNQCFTSSVKVKRRVSFHLSLVRADCHILVAWHRPSPSHPLPAFGVNCIWIRFSICEAFCLSCGSAAPLLRLISLSYLPTGPGPGYIKHWSTHSWFLHHLPSSLKKWSNALRPRGLKVQIVI